MWRVDLAYGTGQLVSLALAVSEVDGVAVARGHGRLRVVDVHMGVLHGGLVRHLSVNHRQTKKSLLKVSCFFFFMANVSTVDIVFVELTRTWAALNR